MHLRRPSPGQEQSPESGISTSHLSLQDAEFVDAEDTLDGTGQPRSASAAAEVDFEQEILPALGRAKAIYPFEGNTSRASYDADRLMVM